MEQIVDKIKAQMPKLKRIREIQPRPNQSHRKCNSCYKTLDIDLFFRKSQYYKSCGACSEMKSKKYVNGEIKIKAKTKDEMRKYNQDYYLLNKEEIDKRAYENRNECRKAKKAKKKCYFCELFLCGDYVRSHIIRGKCKVLHDTLEKRLFIDTLKELKRY